MAHSSAYIIMSRKSHMLRFARAHGIKIPPSFLTLWPHFGAASVSVLKQIQVKLHMRPTGVWDAALQEALFPHPKPKPLTTSQVALYAHAHGQPAIYTEGSGRWQGMNDHVKFPNLPYEADCSSFVTWLFYTCGRNDPNGTHYANGYTGTLTEHGKRVEAPTSGDLVFYHRPGSSTVSHVAMYVGDGHVVSHGKPGGPELLPTAEMDGLLISQYRHYD